MSIRCFKCGSKNIQDVTEKDKSYSVGKGLVGTVLFGAGGAVMGIDGKVTVSTNYVCRDCGWIEKFYMDYSISSCIDKAIEENDEFSLRMYKKRFPNIEWTDKKEEQSKTTKSYEQTQAEILEKVQTYCSEVFDGPIYTSEICKSLGISRINFREMALAGLIPGVKKASW